MTTSNPQPFQVFQFSELSDDAKKAVISQFSDVNVDYEWYEGTYDDAANIGLKITSFDIERGAYVNGTIIDRMMDTIGLIKENHGDVCETYKLAKRYEEDFLKLDQESDEYDYLVSDMEDEFLKELCDEYLTILRDEYEYLTTDKAIIETIESNEYEFLETGKQYF